MGIYKYRKNKTTNLDKLGNELNTSPVSSSFRTSSEAISHGNKCNENQNCANNNAHQMTAPNNKLCDRNQNERKMSGNESHSQERKIFLLMRILVDISTQGGRKALFFKMFPRY